MNRYSKYSDHGSRGFAGSILPLTALFLMAVGGIAWVCMGIVASDRWPIRWLQLNGSFQRVSAEQLRASLATRIDESYFTINLQELGDIAQRIYWVSSARVQKQWPDTITVTVQEYKPIAHWNQGSLISSEGEVFPVPEADEIQGLPWLKGPEERLGEVLRHWAEFSEALVPMGLEISALTLDTRGAWSMELSNGTQVQLGRDAAHERLQRLLASWNELMFEQPVPPLDVDLRYTNGFAVLWPQPGEEEKRKGS